MLMTSQESKHTYLECETSHKTTNPVNLQQVNDIKKKKKVSGEEKCSRLKDISSGNQMQYVDSVGTLFRQINLNRIFNTIGEL